MHINIQTLNYNTAAGPNSVAIGDFNKDGRPDVVTANAKDNSVSLLLSNSEGTFDPATNYYVGNYPMAIAIADVNRDGKLDIVTANTKSNSVSVLISNSDGTCSPASSYDVGEYPYSVTITDLNGDGKLDIVTANTNGGSVSILFGNSDGTFSPASSYDVGEYPRSVVIADLNGDGKLDIITAHARRNLVSVFYGSSGGKFFSKQNSTLFVVQDPHAIAIADINGDGNLDVVTAGCKYSLVSVFFGNSTEIFSTTKHSSYQVGRCPISIAIADLNMDGKLDVVTANDNGHTISVLISNPEGTFSEPLGSPYLVGITPLSVGIADMDGNGKLDIVSANYNSNTISILYVSTYEAPSQPLSKSLDLDGSISQSSDYDTTAPFINQKSVDVPGNWWSNLQPYVVPTAFFIVGLSGVYLFLKQTINAQVVSIEQSMQRTNVKLDGLERKLESEYTSPVTQEYKASLVVGDGGGSAASSLLMGDVGSLHGRVPTITSAGQFNRAGVDDDGGA